jgi:hypothetical protein
MIEVIGSYIGRVRQFLGADFSGADFFKIASIF